MFARLWEGLEKDGEGGKRVGRGGRDDRREAYFVSPAVFFLLIARPHYLLPFFYLFLFLYRFLGYSHKYKKKDKKRLEI